MIFVVILKTFHLEEHIQQDIDDLDLSSHYLCTLRRSYATHHEKIENSHRNHYRATALL